MQMFPIVNIFSGINECRHWTHLRSQRLSMHRWPSVSLP